MPQREKYEEVGGEAQSSAQTLLSMIGGSKSLTSGWAGFAFKTLVVSSSAATVWGLASWMLFHGPLGPALSFIAGSGFGFIGGLVSRWRTDTTEALHLARKYPLLLEHHMRACAGGHELEGISFTEWAHDLRRNPRKQGIVIAAMYSASPALERIHQEQEEALIAAYVQREAEAPAEQAGGDA